MRSVLRTKGCVTFALCLVLVLLPTAPADASHSESYRWALGTDLVFADRNGSHNYTDNIIGASVNWKSRGGNIDHTVGQIAGGCSYSGTLVPVCYADLPSPVVGQAQLYVVGNEIRDAVIYLDPGAVPDSNASLRKNVATHEIGHVLGFAHSTESNSCMRSTITSTCVITNHDYNALLAKYPSSLRSSPDQSGEDGTERTGEKGREIIFVDTISDVK